MTKDSRIKGVRLRNEVADWYDSFSATRVLTGLWEECRKGRGTVVEDRYISRYDALLRTVEITVIEDLKDMSELSGGSLAGMLTDLRDRLDRCEIGMDEGRIIP